MADEKCVRDPRHDCFGLEAAARLEGRIKALEDWQQDSKKFHNSFYDWQREQIARDAKLDEQLSNMDKNIEKLLAKQEEQTAKPGRRWGGHCGQVRVGGAGGGNCLCPGSYRIIRKRRPRRSAASP